MIICGDITALNSLSLALAPEQPWDNGAPNAKASIQLLPDYFRWIGEIKAPLNGKALLALAPEQSWDNGPPNAKASIQLLPVCFRWIGEIKAPLDSKALCRFGTGTAGG